MIILSESTIRVGVIDPGSNVVVLRRITPDLDTFQSLVGGFIEHIDLGIAGLGAYLNEEGKLNGLPLNHLATELWWNAYGPTDMLVGPVVLVGPPDADGNDTGLTQNHIDDLRAQHFRVRPEIDVMES